MSDLNKSTQFLEKSIEQHLEQALEFQSNNQWEKSITSFREVIKSDPRSFKAHFQLGSVLFEQKEWHSAIAYYQKALELRPNFLPIFKKLAKCYLKIDSQNEALNYLNLAVEEDQNQTYWIYKTSGDIYLKQDNLEDAISAYQIAVNIKPEVHILQAKLGKLYYLTEDAEAAESSLRKAISISSDLPFWVYKYLGDACYQQHNWDGAIEAYQRAIALKNNLATKVYTNLALALLHEGRVSEALEIEEYLLQQGKPDSKQTTLIARFLTVLGDFFLQQKDLPQAIKYNLKAIEIEPNFTKAYAKLRLIQTAMRFDSEDIEVAISAYKQAIQQNSNLPKTAYINLGDLLTLRNRDYEAVFYYKPARKQQLLECFPETKEGQIDYQRILEPTFVVIGAMKAGTTSLYSYIAQHSKVVPAIKKEIRFFDQNYQAGKEWYLAHFPPRVKNQSFITGEASPGYISNDVQQKIFDWFPQIKLIAILRDPASRIISHYSHNVKLSLETLSLESVVATIIKDFENIAATDNLEERDRIIGQNAYISNSLYGYHLQKWFDLFPRSQFLIIKSEDLFAFPERVMEQVFKFLELPVETQAKYKTYNPGTYSSKIYNSAYLELMEVLKPYNEQLRDLIDIAWKDS